MLWYQSSTCLTAVARDRWGHWSMEQVANHPLESKEHLAAPIPKGQSLAMATVTEKWSGSLQLYQWGLYPFEAR